jgi:uncharacterized membrane protein YGL010W
MHALLLGLECTIVYAGLYMLLGWMNARLTHHYYEIARRPELASFGNTAFRWLLKVALIYVLLWWIAGMAATANLIVRDWPWPLVLLAHATVLLLACACILVIVWIAFLLQAHFSAISPEFMVAIALCSYGVFAMLPRAHWPWRWIPGLR